METENKQPNKTLKFKKLILNPNGHLSISKINFQNSTRRQYQQALLSNSIFLMEKITCVNFSLKTKTFDGYFYHDFYRDKFSCHQNHNCRLVYFLKNMNAKEINNVNNIIPMTIRKMVKLIFSSSSVMGRTELLGSLDIELP